MTQFSRLGCQIRISTSLPDSNLTLLNLSSLSEILFFWFFRVYSQGREYLLSRVRQMRCCPVLKTAQEGLPLLMKKPRYAHNPAQVLRNMRVAVEFLAKRR